MDIWSLGQIVGWDVCMCHTGGSVHLIGSRNSYPVELKHFCAFHRILFNVTSYVPSRPCKPKISHHQLTTTGRIAATHNTEHSTEQAWQGNETLNPISWFDCMQMSFLAFLEQLQQAPLHGLCLKRSLISEYTFSQVCSQLISLTICEHILLLRPLMALEIIFEQS